MGVNLPQRFETFRYLLGKQSEEIFDKPKVLQHRTVVWGIEIALFSLICKGCL